MILINKILRKFFLFIINTFLSTTNFFTLKRYLLNISGISVGKNSKVVGPIKIGTVARLSIGDECWIGSGLRIYGNGEVNIGDNCDLAPDIAFITGSHLIGDKKRRAGKGISYGIKVKNGCWIGARVTLMGNIIVSQSSVIGACSFVKENIPKDTLSVGIPSRIIKNF